MLNFGGVLLRKFVSIKKDVDGGFESPAIWGQRFPKWSGFASD